MSVVERMAMNSYIKTAIGMGVVLVIFAMAYRVIDGGGAEISAGDITIKVNGVEDNKEVSITKQETQKNIISAPFELIAKSTNSVKRDGVKVPSKVDDTYGWGSDTLLDRYDGKKIVNSKSGYRSASWVFSGVRKGNYKVSVTYASVDKRPLTLLVNGVVALDKVADEPTVGFDINSRITEDFGVIELSSSEVEITLRAYSRYQAWPHFKELKLTHLANN